MTRTYNTTETETDLSTGDIKTLQQLLKWALAICSGEHCTPIPIPCHESLPICVSCRNTGDFSQVPIHGSSRATRFTRHESESSFPDEHRRQKRKALNVFQDCTDDSCLSKQTYRACKQLSQTSGDHITYGHKSYLYEDADSSGSDNPQLQYSRSSEHSRSYEQLSQKYEDYMKVSETPSGAGESLPTAFKRKSGLHRDADGGSSNSDNSFVCNKITDGIHEEISLRDEDLVQIPSCMTFFDDLLGKTGLTPSDEVQPSSFIASGLQQRSDSYNKTSSGLAKVVEVSFDNHQEQEQMDEIDASEAYFKTYKQAEAITSSSTSGESQSERNESSQVFCYNQQEQQQSDEINVSRSEAYLKPRKQAKPYTSSSTSGELQSERIEFDVSCNNQDEQGQGDEINASRSELNLKPCRQAKPNPSSTSGELQSERNKLFQVSHYNQEKREEQVVRINTSRSERDHCNQTKSSTTSGESHDKRSGVNLLVEVSHYNKEPGQRDGSNANMDEENLTPYEQASTSSASKECQSEKRDCLNLSGVSHYNQEYSLEQRDGIDVDTNIANLNLYEQAYISSASRQSNDERENGAKVLEVSHYNQHIKQKQMYGNEINANMNEANLNPYGQVRRTSPSRQSQRNRKGSKFSELSHYQRKHHEERDGINGNRSETNLARCEQATFGPSQTTLGESHDERRDHVKDEKYEQSRDVMNTNRSEVNFNHYKQANTPTALRKYLIERRGHSKLFEVSHFNQQDNLRANDEVNANRSVDHPCEPSHTSANLGTYQNERGGIPQQLCHQKVQQREESHEHLMDDGAKEVEVSSGSDPGEVPVIHSESSSIIVIPLDEQALISGEYSQTTEEHCQMPNQYLRPPEQHPRSLEQQSTSKQYVGPHEDHLQTVKQQPSIAEQHWKIPEQHSRSPEQESTSEQYLGPHDGHLLTVEHQPRIAEQHWQIPEQHFRSSEQDSTSEQYVGPHNDHLRTVEQQPRMPEQHLRSSEHARAYKQLSRVSEDYTLVSTHEHKSNGNRFKCPYCDKRFAGQRQLGSHLPVHTKEKPFHCTICSATFTRQDSLTRHMRIHGNDKPHQCTICDKRFCRPDNLKLHVLRHAPREKLYQCDICHKRFSRQENLGKHMRLHMIGRV